MRRADTIDAAPAAPAAAPAGSSAAANDWLTAQAAPVRRWLLLAVAAGAVGAGAVVLQALMVAWLVHAVVIDDHSLHELWLVICALGAAIALRAAARHAQLRAGDTAAQQTLTRVRNTLLDHLHAAGPARLAPWHHAELSSHVIDSVAALERHVAYYLPQRSLAIIAPLLIVIVAFVHDWLAGLLLLLSAPLIPLFMALVGWGAQHLSERFELQRARAAGVFLDRIRELPSIRLFNAEAAATHQVEGFAQQLRTDTMRVLRVAFLSSAVLEFFAAVAVAAVAIYVGMGLLGYISFGPAPALTLYSGLAVLLLAPEFFAPLRQLATHYHDRAAALGAAEQLLPLLALPHQHAEHSGTDHEIAVADGTQAIAELDRVTLQRDHGPVLQDFSLRVGAGEFVVLWGPSGSGKTSVLHLLAGHLRPDKGSVRVGGIPAGTPGSVAWLGQRAFIARGSIARNIALGRSRATPAQVEAAARHCGVTAFSDMLPEGMDTRIGDGGVGLSGGQAQRVALARAWLSDAPLLLLDEPTSGLDDDAVAPLIDALLTLRASGRTLLVASHDPRLRRAADCVQLLHGGLR